MKNIFLILLFTLSNIALGEELKCAKKDEVIINDTKLFNGISLALLNKSSTIFQSLDEAITVQSTLRTPIRYIETGFEKIPKFPSYSECKQTFFRVATVGNSIDDIITADGWKSGWVRRSDELKKMGKTPGKKDYDAISPTRPIEERIIEYVRVKDAPKRFPKHSSVVGVLENPIRTMSVGYHTGYDNGAKGDHMRMDEIEVGPCAKAPECKALTAVDSTKVFKDRGLTPRYSTEGEWAIDSQIPSSCIVATYRTRFYKVDDTYYSDSNDNTTGGK